MSELFPWRVQGTYFEACNCEAVCPCRRQGDRPGGRSTYGVCDFALSWHITQGHAGSLDLSGLEVVMAGSYADDPAVNPTTRLGEWQVVLYITAAATHPQAGALEEIYLGRAGGTTLANFARAIGTIHAVRRADIRLDHRPREQSIAVEDYVAVRALQPLDTQEVISCGIPGHDHPGTEVVAEVMRVADSPLGWEVTGRCGFASGFDYRGDLSATPSRAG